jgi:hypothetical protein
MAPTCLYPACTSDAFLAKVGRLLPVNFLCKFHQLDEFAIKFVLSSAKFKALEVDFGFVSTTASEAGTEESVLSARV